MNTTAGGDAPDASVIARPFRRVLVAWDGSADSVMALRTAAALVGAGHGHVVALSVLAGRHSEVAATATGDLPAAVRRVRTTFDTVRASIAATLPVRVDLHTTQARQVAGSLCDYAAEHGFDLLVIGRHGEGSLMHPRLGHVAEAAARSCPIPVLLVSAGLASPARRGWPPGLPARHPLRHNGPLAMKLARTAARPLMASTRCGRPGRSLSSWLPCCRYHSSRSFRS